MSAVRFTLLAVGSGLILFLYLPPSQNHPPNDPNRDDKARFLLLQHLQKSASETSRNKLLDIDQLGDLDGCCTMIQPTEAVLARKEKRDEEKRYDSPTQAELFREAFKEKQSEIEEMIASVDRSSDRLKLADEFDRISKAINELSRYLASSTIFLIAYDLKICKFVIQALQDRLTELEAELMPKKKFAFKKRDAARKAEVKVERQAPAVDKPLTTNAYVIEDRTSATLVIEHVQIADKDVTFSRLVNCAVFIHGSPNTLHLIDLTSCKIVSGTVATSVLVENCIDSAFAFPCQQLRIHGCRNDDFHVRVSTRAIIEDTTAVRFGPYRYSYDHDSCDGSVDAGPIAIDDFNWLVNNKPSPNWTSIPDEDQKEFLNSLRQYSNNLSGR